MWLGTGVQPLADEKENGHRTSKYSYKSLLFDRQGIVPFSLLEKDSNYGEQDIQRHCKQIARGPMFQFELQKDFNIKKGFNSRKLTVTSKPREKHLKNYNMNAEISLQRDLKPYSYKAFFFHSVVIRNIRLTGNVRVNFLIYFEESDRGSKPLLC